MDAQADLSLRWAHISICWFCHEVAHVIMELIYIEGDDNWHTNWTSIIVVFQSKGKYDLPFYHSVVIHTLLKVVYFCIVYLLQGFSRHVVAVLFNQTYF